MATPQDLYDILTGVLLQRASDPNVQPGDLEQIQALADDPEALAQQLGIELDGTPMDSDEPTDDAHGEFDNPEQAATEDQQAEESSPGRVAKHHQYRDETLSERLSRLRRQQVFRRFA